MKPEWKLPFLSKILLLSIVIIITITTATIITITTTTITTILIITWETTSNILPVFLCQYPIKPKKNKSKNR